MRRSFSFGRLMSILIVFSMVIPATMIWFSMFDDPAWAESPKKAFTTDFRTDECTFVTSGRNPYFILEEGVYLRLEGEEDKEEIVVEIEVLDEFKDITQNSETITTRVVKETEYKDGELAEESWNWFAICEETNSVFYFGEWVDNYEDGTIDNHEGSWEAGVDGAIPGIMMPGTFLLGARYFQEIAEDVAMDRGENVEMGLSVTTVEGDPAFEFHDCVKVFETTPLEPGAKDFKIYAPGIGLIVDGPIVLVDYVIPQLVSQGEIIEKSERFKKKGLSFRH